MNRTLLLVLALMPLGIKPARAEDLKHEYEQLYECSKKLYLISPVYNIDDDLKFLEPEMLYILDRKHRALYLYTPYFAGKTDLERDNAGVKINDDDAHVPSGTLSTTGSHAFNIRIPYLPDDSAKISGYYYVTVSDTNTTVYREMAYVNGKPHIKEYNPPRLAGDWPHDARISFLDRFLPGAPQKTPDFTNYKARQTPNGITVTSVAGQKDTLVEYHPLDIEDKLWDKNATDNYSPDARDLLIADMAMRIRALPPMHKVGEGSGCEGHMGCDWKYSEEMVEAEHKARADALDTCKAVADEFHLNIFPPDNTAETR
jgi:hypothetical protein